MEKLDKQMVHQVWQRVQQPSENKLPDLLPVLSGLRQEAALYTQMIKTRKTTNLQPLLNQVTSHIACVKGMMVINGVHAEQFSPPPPHLESIQASLCRAYVNALGRLTEYESRTLDSSFGAVFRVLAAETRNALRTLTQIIGNIQ
jgi:hypothetical protein